MPKNSLPPRKVTAPSKMLVEPSLPTLIFDRFDEFVNTFIDLPLRPFVYPHYVLLANFARVDELSLTECEVVEGTLSSCLDSAYIRNNPNPQYMPRGPYHLFYNNGMLRSIRISKGKATLCSCYVKTYKYEVERKIGSSVVPNVFSSFNGLAASFASGALTAASVLSS